MRLSTVVAGVPGATVLGQDVEVRDIAYDSRRVEPGTLFIAVPTVGGPPESGGMRHIDEAIRRGAVAIASGAPIDRPGITSVRVADARAALGEIAATFYGRPSQQLKVFAVTGTDGKTTTTTLLEQVLARVGAVTGLLGTVETRIAGKRVPNSGRMTTPESLDIHHMLRRMVDAGVTHVAMEASSHALALDRLRGVRVAAAALTNLTGDHLEFHGSMQRYVEAKLRLFTEVAPAAPAVLNRDDPQFRLFATAAGGPVSSYGFSPEAQFRARVLEAGASGTTFEIVEGGRVLGPFVLPMPGRFNVANALAACLLAASDGFELATVGAALAHAVPPLGRFQDVAPDAPFRVVVDYAHTPHAFRSLLTELRAATPGNLIAVFGAAGNRDRAKRPVLARIASELTNFFVVTNEDPFGEDAEAIVREVAGGAPAGMEGTRYVIEVDRRAAIRRALERAERGDTVVITGKGHETSIVMGERAVPWSDVETVRSLLAGE